jgi:hypothetical protein
MRVTTFPFSNVQTTNSAIFDPRQRHSMGVNDHLHIRHHSCPDELRGFLAIDQNIAAVLNLGTVEGCGESLHGLEI